MDRSIDNYSDRLLNHHIKKLSLIEKGFLSSEEFAASLVTDFASNCDPLGFTVILTKFPQEIQQACIKYLEQLAEYDFRLFLRGVGKGPSERDMQMIRDNLQHMHRTVLETL